MSEPAGNRQRRTERGVSLYLVALGLIVLMGAAGLGVDLATLYVARNEAQRAADAAALAGASKFGGTAVYSGLMTAIQAEPLAAKQAAQVGNANLIIGRNPDLVPDDSHFPVAASGSSSCPPPPGVSGGCFDFTNPNDPQITVVIRKNMPTYFMRALGVKSVPISVKAVAEAYTAQGTNGPTTSVKCLKPWLLPNCDFVHSDSNYPTPGPKDNPSCQVLDSNGTPIGYYQYFVYPTGSPNAGQLVHPGLKPDGVIGEQLTIKAGNPQSNDVPSPSKFWPVFLPTDGTFTCPSCASADEQNSTSNSAALYRENIECCSDTSIACGYNTIDPISGDMTGPTGQGVDCLIHEQHGTGMDYLSLNSSDAVPFTMYAGANNPYEKVAGSVITTSDSLVTLPLYDGSILCPGNSCPASVSVDVQGFIQLFIIDEGGQQHSVYAYVVGISSCEGGTTSNGGGGVPIPATSGTPVAIRLIHN